MVKSFNNLFIYYKRLKMTEFFQHDAKMAW